MIKRKVIFDLPPWWWWVGVFLSIVLIMFCKEQQEMTLGKVVDALNVHPELDAKQVTCAISGSLIIDKLVSVNDQAIFYLAIDSEANMSVVRIFLPKGWEEIKCKVPLTWPDE